MFLRYYRLKNNLRAHIFEVEIADVVKCTGGQKSSDVHGVVRLNV